ncbi:uncharacterized protein LOC142533314 [Primulina tabacum]|uniref:uncharacterized protein LOC142533314 n=1 Tax=Primulina tabacum TaxID=48773 RepID=UPI003F5A7791
MLFPLSTLESDVLLLNRAVAPLFEFAKFKSLPRGDANWNIWIDRLKKFDGDIWRKQGLYQFIQMSTIDRTFNLDLIEGAIRLWALPCNSFILPCGPMSVTLLDVLHLTGLPLIGNEFASLVDTQELPQLPEQYWNPSSYSQVIRSWSTLKRTSPISEERISFMWVLICKYLFCPSSGKPTMEYLALARSLSVGHVHGLGVMFLGSLYHWSNVAVNDAPLSKLSGAMWFLQMWLFSYFPELKFPPGLLSERLSWRELIYFQSHFTIAGVCSFMRSLPFSRAVHCPHFLTITAEEYPWVGHMAASKKINVSSLVENVRTVILHPRFLVHDGTSPRDQSTHVFEFYNPALNPSQLGLCPTVSSSALYLPRSLNDMMKAELSQRIFTSLSLIELSDQEEYFKTPL